MIRSGSRYWHTIRHLRPVQIYGRLWHRLHQPRIDLRPAPKVRRFDRAWTGGASREPSVLGPETVSFLGETRRVADRSAWTDPSIPKLWLYNLHYFDDLNAEAAADRREWHRGLLRRWVAENPPGQGTGWESYPTSLRITNWVKWARAGNPLPDECVHSLAVQARWLAQRIEHHLQGNHLLANAKALLFAGGFFAGAEGDALLAAGSRLFESQLAEQILPDGGHFERSPMYHAIALEDVLDVLQLAGIAPGLLDGSLVAACRAKAAAMAAWLAVMSHPDGQIAFFNDAAVGIAASAGDLADYGERLGVSAELAAVAASGRGGVWLRDSGYVRLVSDSMVVLIDIAPVGPDHVPGHAHADTLSFELSVHGSRVVVNGGTSRYGTSPARTAERGTAAHSTLEIDGADSSEVWGGFRTARRARIVPPVDVSLEPPQRVSAAHDGYARLPGRPIHRRTWRLSERRLVVVDEVVGSCREAVARFHLHPDVSVVAAGPEQADGSLGLPAGQAIRWQTHDGRATVAPSTWHPRFGSSVATKCIEIRPASVGRAGMEVSFGLTDSPAAAP